MSKAYTVTGLVKASGAWALPHLLMKRLQLTENQNVVLRCGSSSVRARVVFHPSRAGVEIGLSPDLLNMLGIPQGVRLQIKPAEDGAFRLGPVIGILVFAQHIPNRLYYYTKYALYGKNMGIIYVFRRQGIDSARKVINGYYFNNSSGTWQTASLPFPDAVIDRCYPNSAAAHRMLEKVIGPNRIFNKHTLISKTQFADAATKDALLQHHIPETRTLTGPADLNYFLNKYGSAVLKPIGSMKGHGIKLLTIESGKIYLKFKEAGHDVIRPIEPPTPDQVMKNAGVQIRRYIVQQAVKSMDYKGSPFSLRVCPTKNGQGLWEIPGMLALGCGNSFITNYSSGARAIALADLFRSVLPRLQYPKEEFFNLLNMLSLRAAKLLDSRYGPLGEIGIDIIIDKAGKPWVLEANGNPGRTPIFTQTEYPSWPAQLFWYPLAYASLLAGFPTQG